MKFIYKLALGESLLSHLKCDVHLIRSRGCFFKTFFYSKVNYNNWSSSWLCLCSLTQSSAAFADGVNTRTVDCFGWEQQPMM